MDNFTGPLKIGRVDWATYFQDLHVDKKVEADRLLQASKITTLTKKGTYLVTVSRAGLYNGFSLPLIDGEIANFTDHENAIGLTNYLNSVKSHDHKPLFIARYQLIPEN